jgi:hypothetical protein
MAPHVSDTTSSRVGVTRAKGAAVSFPVFVFRFDIDDLVDNVLCELVRAINGIAWLSLLPTPINVNFNRGPHIPKDFHFLRIVVIASLCAKSLVYDFRRKSLLKFFVSVSDMRTCGVRGGFPLPGP